MLHKSNDNTETTCQNRTDGQGCLDGFYNVTDPNDYKIRIAYALVQYRVCIKCPVPNCKNCSSKREDCSECLQGFSYLNRSLAILDDYGDGIIECVDKSIHVKGVHLDETANKFDKCGDRCIACANNTYCTECVEGYILDIDSNTCVEYTYYLCEGRKKSTSEVSFILTRPNKTMSLPQSSLIDHLTHTDSIMVGTKLDNEEDDSANAKLNSKISVRYYHINEWMIGIDVKCSFDTNGNYSIIVSQREMIKVEYNSTRFFIDIYSSSFPLEVSIEKESIQTSSAAGIQAQSEIMTSSNPFVYSTLSVLLMFDVTDQLSQLFKTTQVFNKITYINVKYGPSLTDFLESSSSAYRGKVSYNRTADNVSSRGKLNTLDVTLDVVDFMKPKIITYIVSFIVSIICSVLVVLRVRMRRGYIYVVYYLQKIHNIVFSTVFMDFLFLSPRSLVHNRSLGTMKTIVTWTTLTMVNIDLVCIVNHITSYEGWKAVYAYRRVEKTLIGKGEQAKSKENSAQQKKREINYESTYRRLRGNMSLMTAFTVNIRLSSESYSSPLYRSVLIYEYARYVLMFAVTIAGQYTTTLALSIISMVEIGRILLVVYTYMRLCHLTTHFYLVRQLCMSVYVTLFVLSTMYVSTYDEQPSLTYQSFNMYVVMLASYSEYVMVIVCVVMCVYGMVKKRRIMKDNSWTQMKYSIIVYDDGRNEAPEPQQDSIQLPIRTGAASNIRPKKRIMRG